MPRPGLFAFDFQNGVYNHRRHSPPRPKGFTPTITRVRYWCGPGLIVVRTEAIDSYGKHATLSVTDALLRGLGLLCMFEEVALTITGFGID
jgi:hypothetical protein